MPSFNSVTLVGHVTRDPQLRNLPNGGQVADFGLAMNRKWTDSGTGEVREEVCFVDCSAFGKLADIIGQYVQKGKPLLVSGRLKMDQWEDKQGNKRSKLFVVMEQMQLLSSRPAGSDGDDNGAGRDDGDDQQDSRNAAPPPRQQQQPQRQQSAPPQQRQQQGNQQRQPMRNQGGRRDADIPF